MPHTVSDVPSNDIECVNADETLISALETMFEKDYTQLGIKRNDEIVGIVSYRSISRILSILKRMNMDKNLPGRQVGIAIEETKPIVEPEDDLIVLFDLLSENPYAIVRDPEDDSFEILTNYDLLQYLQDSIEPFLIIEDIERSVRDIIEDAISENLDEELQEFFSDKAIRTPDTLTDCSFGHYSQFISEKWPQFDGYFEENGDFVRQLIAEVGDVRNKIFHFRSESYDTDLEEEMLRFSHDYFQRRLPTRNNS
jgi:hypothetical protein